MKRKPAPVALSEDDLRTAALEIRRSWRKAVFVSTQRKRIDLALGAYVRSHLGWRKELPTKARAAIAARAAELIKTDGIGADNSVGDSDLTPIIRATKTSRDPFEAIEKDAVKAMERMVMSIPFMNTHVTTTMGLGAKGAAIIIAEACNGRGSILSDYPEKGHLWKRMGLGLVDDHKRGWVRQGNAGKNASKEVWKDHGYNPSRRSRIWTLGDAAIKHAGPYRDFYLARKQLEIEKAEAMGLTVIEAAKIPKAHASEYMSKGHVHNRAQRYVEKQMLEDMRKVWRREVVREMPVSARYTVLPVSDPLPLLVAAE